MDESDDEDEAIEDNRWIAPDWVARSEQETLRDIDAKDNCSGTLKRLEEQKCALGSLLYAKGCVSGI